MTRRVAFASLLDQPQVANRRQAAVDVDVELAVAEDLEGVGDDGAALGRATRFPITSESYPVSLHQLQDAHRRHGERVPHDVDVAVAADVQGAANVLGTDGGVAV